MSGQWIAVRDEPDGNYSYDHLPAAGGPFETFEDASEWIGFDERFIAVERARVNPGEDLARRLAEQGDQPAPLFGAEQQPGSAVLAVVDRLAAAAEGLEAIDWHGLAYDLRDIASQLTPGDPKSDDGVEEAATVVARALAGHSMSTDPTAGRAVDPQHGADELAEARRFAETSPHRTAVEARLAAEVRNQAVELERAQAEATRLRARVAELECDEVEYAVVEHHPEGERQITFITNRREDAFAALNDDPDVVEVRQRRVGPWEVA